jgi:hypothetical protein
MGPALPALSLDLPCFARPTAQDQPVLLDVDLVLVQPARPPPAFPLLPLQLALRHLPSLRLALLPRYPPCRWPWCPCPCPVLYLWPQPPPPPARPVTTTEGTPMGGKLVRPSYTFTPTEVTSKIIPAQYISPPVILLSCTSTSIPYPPRFFPP